MTPDPIPEDERFPELRPDMSIEEQERVWREIIACGHAKTARLRAAWLAGDPVLQHRI